MIALLLTVFASAFAQAPSTRVDAQVVVAVTQREDAANALVDQARALGGWFQSRTPTALSLRVPVGEVDALLETAAGQGKVIDRAITRVDVGQDIADLQGRLEAREQVLERYYGVLRTAGADSIVSVERQIVQAIEQIENLKGRLRLLQDQAAFGRVEVGFQFRDRAAPARDGNSSFAWLNTVNVQDVVAGLQASTADWRTRAVRVPEAPNGFSAWKRQGRYRAASPDGVLVRVRAEKHKPKATLDFWSEALQERMVAAGYALQAEREITVDGVPGALIELAAPLGTEDWTYLVAVFVRGNKIVLWEAAGEVATLEARRQDLDDALQSLAF